MIDLLRKVDLHIHTTCSDGDLSVDEVLKVAKERKLEFVGIVDHDTVRQFGEVKKSPLAKELRKNGVKVWTGTEFSCKIGDIKLHILGYNFNPENEKILALIKEAQKLREEDLYNKLENVRSFGLTITREQEEKLKKIENVGKPHIAACLQENGTPGTIDEIIKKYLNVKKILRLETEPVIAAVHEAGGIIVIAHPLQIASENHISEEEAEKVWEKLAKLKADGMECFYSKYDMKTIKKLTEFANRRNLLITFGSDFHGKTKPEIEIGMVYKK